VKRKYNLPRRCGTRVVGGDAKHENELNTGSRKAHKEKCQRTAKNIKFLCGPLRTLREPVFSGFDPITMNKQCVSNVVKLSGTYCVFLLPSALADGLVYIETSALAINELWLKPY